MINHRVMPLRTIVGRSFRTAVQLTSHSELLTPDQIHTRYWTAANAEASDLYGEFHPSAWLREASEAPVFAAEVARYRVPSDVPRPLPHVFGGVFITGPPVGDPLDARKLWAEFTVTLDDWDDRSQAPLVGGLIVCGYPYMPSYLTAQGESAANHGYPREMRVSWDEGSAQGFVDDETSLTRQLPAWQSAYHVLDTGPMVTDTLRLRISDFGRRFGSLRSWDPDRHRYEELWAVALPVIYGFEYEEGTRYASSLPVGMVTATQSNRQRGDSYFSPAHAADAAAFDGADSAWIKVDGDKAYPFTPQSAVLPMGDRRQYPLGPAGKTIGERFVSSLLEGGDRLCWLLAQREENDRCVAGLRVRMTPEAARELLGAGSSTALRLQVYEVDPLPGMPPPRLDPDLDADRFSRLIADQHVAPGAEEIVVRFSRSVLSRYIYVIVTALDKGRVGVDHIELVQSAHVSVVARPSRSQQLRTLHFRLVGANLGDDYARLGERGFRIAVDRIVAGEVRERLFTADSLEDLIRTGVGRLVVNARARAVERQTVTVEPGSYADTYTESRGVGWDRSETGDVTPPTRWLHHQSRLKPDGEHGFTSMGNDETRTHVRHVATIPVGFRNRLTSRFSHAIGTNLDPNAAMLWRASAESDSVWSPWRVSGYAAVQAVKNRLKVSGLWNISIPPYHQRLLQKVEQGNGSVDDMLAIQAALGQMIGDIFTINGAGIGASFGATAPILNLSWSNNISSSGVAAALNSHSIGTTGSVATTARQSGYSYAQALNGHGSEVRSHLEYEGAKHRQVIAREVAEDVDDHDRRMSGAEVCWNGQITDLIVGVIPLGVELPATNEPGYRTTDNAIRFSFGHIPTSVRFDIWLDVSEEMAHDDD